MAVCSETIPPATRWAQREDKIIITLEVGSTNAQNSRQEIKEGNFSYYCETECTQPISYLLEITFFGEIIPSKTLKKENDKEITFVFFKLNQVLWPRLLSSKKKLHYLKTDFEKWIDPEDSGDEIEKEKNLDKLMQAMGQVSEMGGDSNRSLEENGPQTHT